MGRPSKFVGEQLKHVESLIRKHGCKLTAAILAAPLKRFGKPNRLGQLRDGNLFPDPVSVSQPCLGHVAAAAGIALKRGRKNFVVGKKREQYVSRLVRDFGSVRAVEILAGNERDVKLFPNPVSVSTTHLQHIAKRCGVELGRGRVPPKSEAVRGRRKVAA